MRACVCVWCAFVVCVVTVHVVYGVRVCSRVCVCVCVCVLVFLVAVIVAFLWPPAQIPHE